MANEVKIILSVEGNTVKIQEVSQEIQKLGANAEKSGGQGADAGKRAGAGFDGWAASAENAGQQLLGVVGITLSVAGAAYLAEKAFTTWFSLISGGVSAVDDYKTSLISAAAMLTSMTDTQKTPDLSQAYGEWKDYFQWLWGAAIEADKKVAASQREIYETAKELAKKNVVAISQEQVEIVGRLTDFMKSVSPMIAGGEGTARNMMQIKSEIEALMKGVTRETAQTSVALQQIDSNFKENIKRAREMGTVLEYLDSLMQGQKYATADMANTWNSVSASLKSTWQQIQIRAFGDAYDDVVKYGQTLMSALIQGGELTERGKRLADALGVAWSEAKVKVASLLDYILDNSPKVISDVKTIASTVGSIGGGAMSAVQWVSKLYGELQRLAENPLAGALLGAAAGSRLGPYGAVAGAVGGAVAAGQHGIAAEVARGLARGAREFEGYEVPGEGLRLPWSPSKKGGAPPTPPTRPFTGESGGGGKGGGGGAEKGARELMNILDALEKEYAQLTQGMMAGIDEWYKHTVNRIKGVEEVIQDPAQAQAKALEMAEKVQVEKKKKAEEDYHKWLAGATHESEAKINAERTESLRKWGNTAQRQSEINYAYDLKLWEERTKQNQAQLTQTKGYLDALAQASPLIEEQLALKGRALQLEREIARSQLEQWFIGKNLSEEKKDEYRGLLALVNQAKEYNHERQKAVEMGTLEGWAIERAGEALKRSRTNVKEIMTGAENFMSNALGEGIRGALSHEKRSFKEAGKTIAESLALELTKSNLKKVWDQVAKWLAPNIKGVTGKFQGGGENEGESETMSSFGQAVEKFKSSTFSFEGGAQQLQTGAEGNQQAGNLLSLAGASGIAAGAGLGLGAIALMTGSQELMYASMAMQLAALLLQVAKSIPLLHAGGVVAHQGWQVAHGGLDLDERLVIGQVGEGIIKRGTMAEYARRGISFDMLNEGRLPLVTNGGGAGAAASPQVTHHHTTNITLVSPEGKKLGRHQVRQTLGETKKLIKHREIRTGRQ